MHSFVTLLVYVLVGFSVIVAALTIVAVAGFLLILASAAAHWLSHTIGLWLIVVLAGVLVCLVVGALVMQP